MLLGFHNALLRSRLCLQHAVLWDPSLHQARSNEKIMMAVVDEQVDWEVHKVLDDVTKEVSNLSYGILLLTRIVQVRRL